MRNIVALFLTGLGGVALGALMFAATIPPYRSYPSFEAVMRTEALPTVRLMKGRNGACSAVVVAPGYALTAKHCNAIVSPVVDGNPVQTTRDYGDKDVMLLTVPGLKCPCATVDTAPYVPGEAVASIGYPSALGPLIALGHMQGMVTNSDGVAFLMHTAYSGSGMSGGGLFVLRGGRVLLAALTSAGTDGVMTFSTDVTGLAPQLKGL